MKLNMTEFEIKCAVAKGNIVYCVYRNREQWEGYNNSAERLFLDEKVLDKLTNDIREAFKWAKDEKLEVREERYEGRCNNGEGAWLHKSTIKYEGDVEFLDFDQFMEMVADYEYQAELEEHHG